MAFSFPVALDVTGRRCVVIGDGSEAAHRSRALAAAGAEVVVRRSYQPGDLTGAFLAVVTEPGCAAAAFAEAEAKGVLCHAVDDPAHCHYATPSVLRRGELTVAISTGGRAPALAKRLRHRLEGEVTSEYGALVDLLAETRTEALSARQATDFATWAGRWQAALADLDDLLALLAEGRRDEARRRVLLSLTG